jgi:hypothetical protein
MNDNSRPRLSKGDRVFVEETQILKFGLAQYREVVSVGNKYFRVEGLRAKFFVSTWEEDSQYSPAYRIWESEEKYREEKRKDNLWGQLKRVAGAYRPSSELTSDRIEQALKILGAEIDESI